MNRKLLILFAFVLATSWTFAQHPGRERIRTLKIAFITERVSLTSEEAQDFWPIYNEYESKLERIRRKERMELKSRIGLVEDLTDSESARLLEQYASIQKEKYDAEQDFISKIKHVISPKKTLLLLKAEEDFKRRLLQQMRKRRMNGG